MGMAKKLTKFPDPVPAESDYPWDDWLNGKIWRLTKGVDFDCLAASLRGGAHAQCRRRGLTLRATVRGDVVVLWAVKA